jgi:hypothetical protein
MTTNSAPLRKAADARKGEEPVTRPTTLEAQPLQPAPADAATSVQRRNVIFVAVMLGMLLAALDQTGFALHLFEEASSV